MFVGYLKGIKGWLFYSPRDNKEFVSTNAKFLEDNYVNNFKSNSMVLLEEMLDYSIGKSLYTTRDEVVVSDKPRVTTHETLNMIIPCRSRRIIRASDRFMFLGEAYKAILKGPKSDLKTYEKTINGVDANC